MYASSFLQRVPGARKQHKHSGLHFGQSGADALLVESATQKPRRVFDGVRFLPTENKARENVCASESDGVVFFSLSHTRGGRILCNFGLLKTENDR